MAISTMFGCRWTIWWVLILAILQTVSARSSAGFLHGLQPVDYNEGDPLDVFATKISGRFTSLPLDYFSLPLCRADPIRQRRVEVENRDHISLGQILQGERARLTAYDLRMKQDVECAIACTKDLNEMQILTLKLHTRQNSRVHLNLDDMPVVMRSQIGSSQYSLGYPLGLTRRAPLVSWANAKDVMIDVAGREGHGVKDPVASVGQPRRARRLLTQMNATGSDKELSHGLLYNHLDFTVLYHKPNDLESLTGSRAALADDVAFRVVGFEVSPKSVAYPLSSPPEGVPEAEHCLSSSRTPNVAQNQLYLEGLPMSNTDDRIVQHVRFTYSVKFVESGLPWATRWDPLFETSFELRRVQWLSAINSLMLALFLTFVFAGVLVRTLRRDCARYGFTGAHATGMAFDDLSDDFDSVSGWRMLRGDVFRPPPASKMLSILCGCGIQLAFIALSSLVLATLGIVRPNRRGQLVSTALFAWGFSSGIAGYTTAALHRLLGGMRWKGVAFGVAVALPGVAFAVFLLMNVFMWGMGSIGAAPFLTLCMLVGLWLGVSVPLAFVGAYFGSRQRSYSFPVRTNQIPRMIPKSPFYLKPPYCHLFAGLLPFGVICIELRLVLQSIWHHQFYHMFAFLFFICLLLVITCAEVSIVLSYLRLANEDWRWWWPSFWASGASGLYIFSYSVFTLATSEGVDPSRLVSNFVFLSYSALLSAGFTLATGSIGCLSSLVFIRRVFSMSADD